VGEADCRAGCFKLCRDDLPKNPRATSTSTAKGSASAANGDGMDDLIAFDV